LINVHLSPQKSDKCSKFRYRFAEVDIASDTPLTPPENGWPAYLPWELSEANQDPGSQRNTGGSTGSLSYRGSGWLGGEWRQVECLWEANWVRLWTENAGEFSISQDGLEAIYSRPEGNPSPALISEIVLGPVLILMLAMRDTFCLHASAVTFNEGLIAFSGESGAGKSTLAAYLSQSGLAASRLAADDILPVRAGQSEIVALPHFPQLKLPSDNQPWQTLPERMPLKALFLVNQPPVEEESPRISAVTSQRISLALIRHTVASRLFNPLLLKQHLEFCATQTLDLPVFRIEYPKTPTSLHQTSCLVESTLAGIIG
jgi:hypothetical protein